MGLTNATLIRYTTVETHYVCLKCQDTYAKVLSQKIFVEFERGGKREKITLRGLVERYQNNFELSYEEASRRLPKLPFETIEATIEHTFCTNCKDPYLGTEEDYSFPPSLPAKNPTKSGPIESPNESLRNKKGRKSRSIKPKNREATERTRRIKEIETARIEDLV